MSKNVEMLKQTVGRTVEETPLCELVSRPAGVAQFPDIPPGQILVVGSSQDLRRNVPFCKVAVPSEKGG